MRIKSMSKNSKIVLHDFCLVAAIKHSYECVTASDIDLFDFWIDDENEKLNLLVKSKEVCFYTHDYICKIYRDEFQEIQII